MVLKKQRTFSFALIAIVFLFLNSASLSAFGLKTSFENSRFANNCLLQNSIEAVEKSSLEASSFETQDSDFSFRHPSPNRFYKKEISYIVFDYHEWLPKISFVSYNPLLRPAYYHFLFQHNLF